MSRKRWVYRNGEAVEVGEDFVNTRPVNTDAVLWTDRSYQDMGDPRFASRTQHRAYMKQNNVTTMDDFKGTWSQAAKERESAMKGVDPARREQVARAVHQHLNRRSS